jgi:hypothetical protein
VTITEQERHDLYERLQETLGEAGAETLMQYLPTTGVADLVTKSDLNALEATLRAEMRHMTHATDLKLEAMEHRILGTLRQEMRIQLLAMVGIAIALAGLILRFG